MYPSPFAPGLILINASSQHVSSTIGDTKDAHEAAQAGVTPVGLTLRNASSQHVSSTIGDPKDAPEAAQAGVTPVHHLKPVEPTRQADPKNKQPPQTEPVAKTRSVKPVQRSKEEQRGHDASQKQTAWLQSLKTKPEDTRNADSTSNAESNYSRSFNEQESRNLPRLRGTPEQLQASTLDLAVSVSPLLLTMQLQEARQCLPQTKQGGKRMPYTTVPIQSNAARLGRQDPPSKALPRSDRYGFRTERTGLAASGNTGERVSFEDILKMDKSEVYNKVNVVSRPAHVRSPQHKTASELGEIPAEITELLAASESFEAPNSRSDDWQSAAPSEVSPERKKPAASTTSPMWSDATAIERPRQDSPPRSIGPHKPLPTEGKIVNGTQPLPTCDTSARVGNIPADTEKLPETQPRTDPTPPENMGAEVEEALPTSSPTPTHNPTVAAESYPWNNPSSDDDSDVESIGTHDESSHSSQRSSESKRYNKFLHLARRSTDRVNRASLKPNSGMGDLRQRLALLKKR